MVNYNSRRRLKHGKTHRRLKHGKTHRRVRKKSLRQKRRRGKSMKINLRDIHKRLTTPKYISPPLKLGNMNGG